MKEHIWICLRLAWNTNVFYCCSSHSLPSAIPLLTEKKQLTYWQCSTSLNCRNEFECGEGAFEWKSKIQGKIILYLVAGGLLIWSHKLETLWYPKISWIWLFPWFLEVILNWINFLARDLWFVCSNSRGAGVWGHLCLIQSYYNATSVFYPGLKPKPKANILQKTANFTS